MGNCIVVCGKQYDIGTKVVLWNESQGFNAYDISKRTVTSQDRKTGKKVTKIISGKRYSSRTTFKITKLSKLQEVVTQFFLHHSGLYRSRDTFNVLHNQRGLSVHFILDDDGVLYQTLDLVEKAWHGGGNNPMSVGIEIDSRAHAGKYPDAYDETRQSRYAVDPRTKRMDKIHGQWVLGFEYTNKQYETLIKLGYALKTLFPKMTVNGKMDFPRTNSGIVIKTVLSNPKKHQGILCHYNNSTNKIDPISFDHDRLVTCIETRTCIVESTFIKANTWEERQKWLKFLGYDPGPIDGIFGPKTKKAVQKFQTSVGRQPDGKWNFYTDYLLDLEVKKKRG